MSPLIRPFTSPDREALVDAINAVCREGCWMSTPRFRPTPAWAHALEVPQCLHHALLIAEDRGRVVGWCRLFPKAGCGEPSTEAELGIGLLAAYRGRGWGKALLQEALGWATGAGLRRVVLTTRTDNLRAIHLFTNHGFIETGRRADGWIEMAFPLPGG